MDNSAKARDLSLAQVSENAGEDFMVNAFVATLDLPDGEYTGEDIRFAITKTGVVPHHPNAWGAVIMNLVRHGILKDTGKYTKMRSRISHARRTPVYLKRGLK